MKLGVRISLAGLLAAALTAGSCLFPAASGPVSPWLLNVSRAPTEKKASVSEEQFPSVLYGTWSGVLPTFVSSEKYVEDPVTLSIPEESENRQPALKVGSYGGSYLLPNSWSVSKGTLRFTLYDSAWQMAVELQAVSEIELTGVVRQYGEEMTVTLYKLSDTAEDLTASPRFIFENEEASVWQERLSAYPSFSESSSGTPIPFTYELWRWDRSNQLPVWRRTESPRLSGGEGKQPADDEGRDGCGVRPFHARWGFRHAGEHRYPFDTFLL